MSDTKIMKSALETYDQAKRQLLKAVEHCMNVTMSPQHPFGLHDALEREMAVLVVKIALATFQSAEGVVLAIAERR